MAESYWPFDNADTTENQYSQLMRRIQSTGVYGDPGDNNLRITADSSGLNVKLSAGYAFIRGHMYYNDAVKTIAIGAGAANPRIDRVVLRVDPTANTITTQVIAGTAAATPSAPALTQTDAGVYDLLLADVAVPASAATIVPSNVTDRRTFAGHFYGSWETATRPTAPIRKGQPGHNSTTGRPEYWTGTAWSEFAPATVAASIINGQVSVANGGTGAANATDARTNLGITPANIGASPTGHTHDDRYYTEAEIDAKLNSTAASGHTHDDRYFTETEVNSLLAGKAASSHTHDDRYFTETEVTNLLAGKANTSHSHSWDSITGKPVISNAADGSTLVQRNPDGGAVFQGVWLNETGANAQHAAQRGYVDGRIGEVYNALNGKANSDWVGDIGRGNLSPDVYNRNITWTRRATWTGDNGQLGYAPSIKATKQDFVEPDFTLDQLRAGVDSITFYKYRAEVAKAKADPTYHVATELGHLADDLHAAGLWPWVIYEGHEEEAKPVGVHYELTGLLAQLYAKAEAEELRERVSRLEAAA